MRIRAASVFLAIAVAGAAVAQLGDQKNAADYYRRAFDAIASLSENDLALIRDYQSNPSNQLNAEVQAALRRAEPAMRLFRAGAAIDHVDFGIDYSAGLGTLLPHLTPMRTGALLLVADARAHLARGDTRGAAEAFAVGLRMSDHVTADPVLINSLVGVAMFSVNSIELRRALDEGTLDMRAATAVLEAATAMAHGDPLGFVASLEGERAVFSGWMMDNFTGEGGRERLLDELPDWMPSGEPDSFLLAFSDMTQHEIDTAIFGFDLAQERMIAAAKIGDLEIARQEMKRIQDDVALGVYGPIPQMLMPALDRYVEVMIATYGNLNSLLDDLTIVAGSPDGAAALRNAALWYLRAIAMRTELTHEEWRVVIDFAQTRPDQSPESVRKALDKAQPIIEQLLTAAGMGRCRFDLKNRWAREGMLADLNHLPGMVECGQLLAADAWMRLLNDDADQRRAGALYVAAIYRMAFHLGTDQRIASARGAAEIAQLGLDVGEAIGRRGIALSPHETDAVHDAMNHLRRGDPFGYLGARRSYRTVTTEWLLKRYLRDQLSRDGLIGDLQRIAGPRAGEIEAALTEMADEEIAAALRALDAIVERAVNGARGSSPDSAWQYADLAAAFARRHPLVLAEWMLDPLARAADAKRNVLSRIRAAAITSTVGARPPGD